MCLFPGCHKSVCRLVRICVIARYLNRYALNYMKKCQKSNFKIPCKQRFFSCMAFSIYQVVRVACQSRSWFKKQSRRCQSRSWFKKQTNYASDKQRERLRKCQKPCKRKTPARRVTLRWKSNLVLFSLFFLLLLLPDNVVHTKAAMVVQIDLQDSLQTMLEGSFKSGKVWI